MSNHLSTCLSKQLGVPFEMIRVESADVPVVVDVRHVEFEPLVVCGRASVLIQKVRVKIVESDFIVVVFVNVLKGLVMDLVARAGVRE